MSCQVEARPQGVRRIRPVVTSITTATKGAQVVKPRHKKKERNGTLTWVETALSAKEAAQDPPTHHGGPVMSAPVKVYLIWYGNWNQPGLASATSQAIVRNFIYSFNVPRASYAPTVASVAGWHAINFQYYGPGGATVTPSVVLQGEVSDSYSRGGANGGYSLTDGDIQAIATASLRSQGGAFPDDTNGIYFVLTSPDVKKGGFCTDYCGWHSAMSVAGQAIKYAFVGNPATQCINGCASQFYSGYAAPNGDTGADGMVNIIAHELEEAATDPQLNAWYNSAGYENADICVWSWGTVLKTAAAVNKVNVGSYVSIYTQNGYKGTENTMEAPVPGVGCFTLPSTNRPLNSLKIRWNVNDGKPNHVGCGRFIMWDQVNCYGNGLYWEIPGGWKNFNSTKYDYPESWFTNVGQVAGRNVPNSIKALSCDSYVKPSKKH
eukprot:jgi/Mesen1/10053/ME000073S09332